MFKDAFLQKGIRCRQGVNGLAMTPCFGTLSLGPVPSADASRCLRPAIWISTKEVATDWHAYIPDQIIAEVLGTEILPCLKFGFITPVHLLRESSSLGWGVSFCADPIVHWQECLQDPAPEHILVCEDLSHHRDEETAEGILLTISILVV